MYIMTVHFHAVECSTKLTIVIIFTGSDSITVSVDDGGLKMLQITDTGRCHDMS